MIIAVIYATFAVAKRKPEKNSGLYGIRTFDLYDTGAVLFNSSLHSSHIIYDFLVFQTSVIILFVHVHD